MSRPCKICHVVHTKGKHTLTTERKPPRPAFDMANIKLVGPVDVAAVPTNTHAIPGGKRRWEELCDLIKKYSVNNQWYQVDLSPSASSETVRQGVAAELERDGMRSRARTRHHEDGGASIYFFAVTKNGVSQND